MWCLLRNLKRDEATQADVSYVHSWPLTEQTGSNENAPARVNQRHEINQQSGNPKDYFTYIWASPDCRAYSAARSKAKIPHEKAMQASDPLLGKTRQIIAYFAKPKPGFLPHLEERRGSRAPGRERDYIVLLL